jgi:hypothetical protein
MHQPELMAAPLELPGREQDIGFGATPSAERLMNKQQFHVAPDWPFIHQTD